MDTDHPAQPAARVPDLQRDRRRRSRTVAGLLARRLRELERAGVLEIRPKPSGRGSVYEPTPAGKDLAGVLEAIGGWAERWTEMQGEHADPDVVLWSWSQTFLRRDLLPDRRVVVRFEFTRHARRVRLWLLAEGREVEICRFDPGFGDDLVVAIDDPLAFARWHRAGSSGQRRCATARSPSPGRGRCARPCRPGTPGRRRTAACGPSTACRSGTWPSRRWPGGPRGGAGASGAPRPRPAPARPGGRGGRPARRPGRRPGSGSAARPG